MPVDVSVVVPVFNTGQFLEPCIESLLAQTLPPGQVELIFVDDGSTDETPARLDRLALEHPHVRVFHEPPSGWPGRPRNVGIDAARGEFVYFVDHDDVLAPAALEHLVATARRTDADIVLGKVVGIGRGARLNVFAENVDHATLADHPLMATLTPHKLFRKQFLDEHGIRFPEGKRRLEDHVFVVRAYFAARTISILADRPCYYQLARTDEGNAASTPIDPPGYFANVRETLDVIDANTEPGPFRDRVRSRFLETEALRRLSEERIWQWSPEYLRELVAASGAFIAERYTDDAVDALPAVTRARARAVRDGNVDDLLDIAARTKDVAANARLERADWTGTAWALQIRAELTHADGRPVSVRPDGDGWVIDPALLPERHQASPYPTEQITRARASVVLRNRKTSVQWMVASALTATIEPVADGGSAPAHRVVVSGTVLLDPATAAAGRRLSAGTWEVTVRVAAFGLSRPAVLPPADLDPDALPALVGKRPNVVALRPLPRRGTLGLTVERPGPPLVRRLAKGRLGPAALVKKRLVLDVGLHSAPGSAPVRGHVDVAANGRRLHRVVCRLGDGRLVLRLRDATLPAGRLELRLRLRPKTKPVPLTQVEVTDDRKGRPTARVLDAR